MANTITADDIREHFSQAMSAMYQQEVPQYGTLLELVADVNLAVLENNPLLHEQLANADELCAPERGASRGDPRRHGTGTFNPAPYVCHYGHVPGQLLRSLSGGVPVHSTAFRPIEDAALCRNPFRILPRWLRLDLIENVALRERAAEILSHATSSPRAAWN